MALNMSIYRSRTRYEQMRYLKGRDVGLGAAASIGKTCMS
jgi:hypothetical protein